MGAFTDQQLELRCKYPKCSLRNRYTIMEISYIIHTNKKAVGLSRPEIG
jgi:hypothetical protein